MKKSIIILVLILTLVSCTKENFEINRTENNGGVTTFEDYFKLIQSDTDGLIALSSVSSLESENMFTLSSVIKGNKNPYNFNNSEQNQKMQHINIYKSATISNWCDTSRDLSEYFGAKLKLNLNGNNITTSNKENSKMLDEKSNMDLYIPELLKVNVDNLKNGKFTEGTIITWNADPNNKKGIIIAVEYRKLNQVNQSIAENNTKDIVRGSTMEDAGTYTITAEDLSHFPNDAILTFSIGRAGYTIISGSDGETDIAIGAYTLVRSDFHISN